MRAFMFGLAIGVALFVSNVAGAAPACQAQVETWQRVAREQHIDMVLIAQPALVARIMQNFNAVPPASNETAVAVAFIRQGPAIGMVWMHPDCTTDGTVLPDEGEMKRLMSEHPLPYTGEKKHDSAYSF